MNKLVVYSDRIVIKCDRGDADIQKLCSTLYPVHSNRIGTVHTVSIHKLPEVLDILRNVNASNVAEAKVPKQILEAYYKELKEREVLKELIEHGACGSPVVTPTLTLKPHQQLGREIAASRDRFGFFFDTRTGKTPLSLAVMHDDLQQNPDHRWLVICPLILIENAWLCDAADFIPDVKIANCHASTKAKRLKAIETAALNGTSIFVTNTESFADYKDLFMSLNFTGCFVDESSSMKSPSSQQSKALVDFSQTMQRWYLLTGTPAPNGEWEYFMQMRSIDYFCMPPSNAQFEQRYFINLSNNVHFKRLTARPDTHDELLRIIKERAMYCDKQDVLDLPGRSFETVTFTLDEDVKKQYTKMKRELAVTLAEDCVITAPSAATKLNKLNQITSGFIIDTEAKFYNKYHEDQKQEVYLMSKKRFETFYNLVFKSGKITEDEQIVIWAYYHKEFEVLKDMLGDDCRCIYGLTSLEEKTEAIKLFKAGKVRFLIANPASADKGLTLTNAHVSIYFSLGWSYETYKQSVDRIYADRIKQPHFCRYYTLVAENTVDKILLEDVLQGKATASMAVLNHLKSKSLL